MRKMQPEAHFKWVVIAKSVVRSSYCDETIVIDDKSGADTGLINVDYLSRGIASINGVIRKRLEFRLWKRRDFFYHVLC